MQENSTSQTRNAPLGEFAAKVTMICALLMALERVVAENPLTVRASTELAFEGDFASLTWGALFRLVPRSVILCVLVLGAMAIERQFKSQGPEFTLRARHVVLGIAGAYAAVFIAPTVIGFAPGGWIGLWLVVYLWPLAYIVLVIIEMSPRLHASGLVSRHFPPYATWSATRGPVIGSAHLLAVVLFIAGVVTARQAHNAAAVAAWKTQALSVTNFAASTRKGFLEMRQQKATAPEISAWASKRGDELNQLRERLDATRPPPSRLRDAEWVRNAADMLGTALNLAVSLTGEQGGYTYAPAVYTEGGMDAQERWRTVAGELDSAISSMPPEIRAGMETRSEELLEPYGQLAAQIQDAQSEAEEGRSFVNSFEEWLRSYGQSRLELRDILRDVEADEPSDSSFYDRFQTAMQHRRELRDRLRDIDAPPQFAAIRDGFYQLNEEGMEAIQIYYNWYSNRGYSYSNDSVDYYREAQKRSASIRKRLKDLMDRYSALAKSIRFNYSQFRVRGF